MSKFSDNYRFEAKLGLLHFLVDCDYFTDADFNYRNIKITDKFQFQNYTVEGKINFSHPKILPNYTNLYLGFGLSDMNKANFVHTKQAGYMLGIGTALPISRTFSEINVKSVYWTHFWEWKGEIKSEMRRFVVSAYFDIIDLSVTMGVKVGYKFHY